MLNQPHPPEGTDDLGSLTVAHPVKTVGGSMNVITGITSATDLVVMM